ncbi:induced myeloid leukemia cell differentiation protein Mcl-1 homolog isoform X2 [Sinocyclocheilus anshuiensis]|uniref:induced myeloid leukemia cell differentiation protein Mcl-1 homolog isoform X2 n=1 Tax=Sinocyclocheilus anshuiensis TaxID=1608454 RepID=UPI0007BAD0E5|nr:PREDICTED: induced myeloid leukemia cell differentiation protein Mcl-1 homolog isoform X2 [Sinocyclocheilus anshuiensis]
MTLSLVRRTAAVSLLGAHTALVPAAALKARSEDELDGCADEPDAAGKPVRPGANGLRGLQLDGRFVSAADGSLPSTPDPQELGSAELDRDTRQLLLDFYRTHTGMCPQDRKQHHALPTMTQVVADILLKHEIAYKGMLQRLQLESQADDMSFISCIAETMFNDNTTNWGRIVSLVAFGAVVCSRLKELQRERCVETVAQQISSYLISEQHDWLLNNKGWHGFVEFFCVEDVESVIRNALMAVVGCAGIGAGLAFLIR